MCVPFLAYFTLLDQKRKQTLGGIGIESNLRKLLLSLLTLLFVWHILLCWNKNVNNHWVESESNRIYGSCLYFLLSLLTLLFVFTAKSLNRDDGQIIGFLK